MSTPPSASANTPVGIRKTLLSYCRWRILNVLLLGFASALPLAMVFSKLSFWLREEGIDRTTIGGMYSVSLAYSLKFLWSPLVDHVDIPFLTKSLGKRRSWIFASMISAAVGLATIATSSPSESLIQTLIGALILAYSGATLDICIDAWRIESAPPDEQANMASAHVIGYRLSMLFAGIGMMVAEVYSWHISYGLMALTMVCLAGLVLWMNEPTPLEPSTATEATPEKSPTGGSQRVRRAIVEPFLQLQQRFGHWLAPVLLLVVMYRLSDFTMGVMASPFYADLGYSKTVVGGIQGIFGPWPAIAGGLLGGLFSVRFTLMRALVTGALLTIITNGAFALLAVAAGPGLEDSTIMAIQPPPAWMLLVIISADNLASGFVTTVFIAYMSSLTDRRFAATQYALLSSGYAFFAKLMAVGSGVLADTVGWTAFFLVTAAYGVPGVVLILLLVRYGPNHAQGKYF